jgi:hypothetical protein
MQPTADRLAERLHTLTKPQLAEVESFVASLQAWEQHHDAARLAAPLSEPAFAAVWNNPEDEVYDAL